MTYEHPLYNPESVAAQSRLSELGTGTFAFAGAYHGWGFHEDGALSGLAPPNGSASTAGRGLVTAPSRRSRRSSGTARRLLDHRGGQLRDDDPPHPAEAFNRRFTLRSQTGS